MVLRFPLLPAIAALALASPIPTFPVAGSAAPSERFAARFAPCDRGPRIDCVVDGDTFWLAGNKIRIADINAPETHGPGCAYEAALAAAATTRLTGLLNAGPFGLDPWTDGRNRDRYGRLLRIVMRGGASVGDTLVREGLAERWTGHRRNWCADA